MKHLKALLAEVCEAPFGSTELDSHIAQTLFAYCKKDIRDMPPLGRYLFDDITALTVIHQSTLRGFTTDIKTALFLIRYQPWFWTIGECDLSGHVTIGPDYNGPEGECLKKQWPVDIWHGGINFDLRDGLNRVERALVAANIVRIAATGQLPGMMEEVATWPDEFHRTE
jgi:hypothetical protein